MKAVSPTFSSVLSFPLSVPRISQKFHLTVINLVVHAADIPYVFGPSITLPSLFAPLDLALSLTVQRAYLSFAANLSPNRLGDLAPGLSWPQYHQGISLIPSIFPAPLAPTIWVFVQTTKHSDYNRHRRSPRLPETRRHWRVSQRELWRPGRTGTAC
jgi:hypothetical protein